jgi:hypothetical protein
MGYNGGNPTEDTAMNILMYAIPFVVFAAVGFMLGRFLPQPKKFYVWALWVLLAVVTMYIGTSVRLFALAGTDIYLKDVLQAVAFGVLMKFFIQDTNDRVRAIQRK